MILNPHQDYQYLYDTCVVGIFGTGTSVAKAATSILEVFIDSYKQ